MKAIVLAGGYAKRLWPLTKELAKPLVDVGGKPVIFYILDALEKSEHINEMIISTNEKFAADFKQKLQPATFSKPIKIIAEPTLNENEKLGAIGGINFIFEKENLNEDILIIGGDNIIGVDINKMIEDFRARGAPHVGIYDIKDRERVKQLGEVTVDADKKIIRFREKPEAPETTLISTACYLFPAGIRAQIKEYISSGGNRDAPGHFIKWLAERIDVYAHVFDSYWFDIGDHETLERAREFVRTDLKQISAGSPSGSPATTS